MEYLNLFVIPVISLYIYGKRAGKEIGLKFESLALYSFFTVATAVISFALLKFCEMTFGFGAEPGSQVYTLVALLVAFVMPYVLEMYRVFINIRCEIKGKNEKKQ